MQEHFKADAVEEMVKVLRPILELTDPNESPTIPGSDAYVPSYLANGADEREGDGKLQSDSQRNGQH